MTTTDNSRADALTEALIRKIAAQYCEYDTDSKTYNILRYECEADFFNCIRELLDAFPDLQPAAAPIDTPTDREFALSAAICVHPKGVYGDEGGSMCCPITHTRDASFAPSPADERSAFETLKGAWQSMPPFDVFCAGWRAARASSPNAAGAEGVRAWETDDGRVISDEQKQKALRDGGASASSVRPYAHALGRIAPAQAPEPVSTPAGWKLVPVAPTPEMCCAMEEAIDAGWKDSVVWARGIAAAPQPLAPASAPVGLTEQAITDAVKKWFPDRAYQAPFFARELLEGAKQ